MTKQPEARKPDQPLALSSSDVLGLSVMKPACWTLRSELDAADSTCGAHMWFSDPRNSGWEALYRRDAIDRVLAHSREVHQFNAELHASNESLRSDVLDMREVMLRLVAGVEHLAKIARQWEPDHSSGADRRGWLLAQDAKDDAKKLLAEQAARILRPTSELRRRRRRAAP